MVHHQSPCFAASFHKRKFLHDPVGHGICRKKPQERQGTADVVMQATKMPFFFSFLKYEKFERELEIIVHGFPSYTFSLIFYGGSFCNNFFFSGCDCSLRFKNLMSDIMKSSSLAEMYNSVRCE